MSGLRQVVVPLAAFAIAWPFAAEASSPPSDFVVYNARKGDSLYTLARSYLRQVGDYAVIQRLNGVQDPYRLPIGRPIRIPRELLRFQPLDGTIIAFRGRAQVIRGGGQAIASVGAAVREGDVLATSANSFLTIRLPDDSIVSLPSQTQVRIERLRRYDLTGGVDRSFKLMSGRARAIVSPMSEPDDGFKVVTPVSVGAVRGTEFRTSYDAAGQRAGTEVLEGTVDVAAGSSRSYRPLPAGEGALASAVGTVQSRLLPAPRLIAAGKVQDEPSLAFSAEPVAGVSGYHFAIAADAGFLDVLQERFTSAPNATFETLPNGTWFVRVTAVDGGGLEGLPATYSFERQLNAIETSSSERRAGRYREYLFRWHASGEGVVQSRFQLFQDSMDTTPLIDAPGLSNNAFVLTDLPPGNYIWRVMTLQLVGGKAHAKWSRPQQLAIAKQR